MAYPKFSSEFYKNLIVVFFALVLVVGSYSKINSRATQDTLSIPNVPILSPSNPSVGNLGTKGELYIQTWSDTPSETPDIEVYEIHNNVSKKIFTASSDQITGIEGFISQGLLTTADDPNAEKFSAFANKLLLYNTNTLTTEPLLDLPTGHTLTSIINLDKNKLIFSDHCGVECESKDGEVRNFIKLLDLETKSISTIYSDIDADFNLFYAPFRFAGNNEVVLRTQYEVTDGTQYYPEIFTLNIKSKKVTKLPLDKNADSISVEPNGAGIIFTTFTYDEAGKTSSSKIMFKSLNDNTSKSIKESSQKKYESTAWLDQENIAVLVKNIQFINKDCAYEPCVEGKETIEVINTKTKETEILALPVEPIGILSGDQKHLYYLSSTESPDTYLGSINILHMYDLDTDTDTVILKSARWITSI